MAGLRLNTDTEPPLFGQVAASGIVIIEIGTERQRYHVHKALLARHSDYFNRALTGSWEEAQEGVVALNDVDTAAFDLFLQWLYTQTMPNDMQISTITETDDLEGDDDGEQTSLLWIYIRAYVLGTRILSPAFCTSIINCLNRDCLPERMPYKETSYPHILAYAFANLPSDNTLLLDLVEDYSLKWRESLTKWNEGLRDACFHISVQEELPSAFLARVMHHRLVSDAEDAANPAQWFGVEEILLSM
ncbi:hypothetical protein OPT61_g5650 [Boeremia exigua]|uniref:Uncharacterized protein n=1 Tax=Boeremia exigua TaxID=749465 RepID=A0ACC2I9J4_9PLEO|nr:hypothetical protein OPT61_g5650 [Boeremia exigua]